MFVADHNPPHFHVRYTGHKARVALDGTILAGDLPRGAARLVMEWEDSTQPSSRGLLGAGGHHEPRGTIESLP